ncbi:hypothetical protein O4H66_12405 [Comamonadaceae bacterium G21597-S1]|nr:hypothetical protein [Comamonadaceae bacterium G21597-S1]
MIVALTRRVGALAATCALLMPCASTAASTSTTPDYRPAPRSSLVTTRDPAFLIAQWKQGPQSWSVLASQLPGAAPRPVARLVQVRQGSESHVSVQRLGEDTSEVGHAQHAMAVLAQLYTLILRLDPLARYCIGDDGPPCDAVRDGISQGQVLQVLAGAREHMARRTDAPPAWRVVDVRPEPMQSRNADIVGVRVASRQGPLSGVSVYFDRAPHSICHARTGADGVAACQLVDQHGDEHEHDHDAPVVVTFPGDMRGNEVLLPTTHVLRTPSFAPRRPFMPGGR